MMEPLREIILKRTVRHKSSRQAEFIYSMFNAYSPPPVGSMLTVRRRRIHQFLWLIWPAVFLPAAPLNL